MWSMHCDQCMWFMHVIYAYVIYAFVVYAYVVYAYVVYASYALSVMQAMHSECTTCVCTYALWVRHSSSMPCMWRLRSRLCIVSEAFKQHALDVGSAFKPSLWSRCESHILLSDQGVIKVWKPHPSSWSRCESHILWHSCSCPQVVNKFSKLLQCGSRVYVCGSWARHLSYTLRRPPEMGVVILSRCLRKIGDILV